MFLVEISNEMAPQSLRVSLQGPPQKNQYNPVVRSSNTRWYATIESSFIFVPSGKKENTDGIGGKKQRVDSFLRFYNQKKAAKQQMAALKTQRAEVWNLAQQTLNKK